MPAVMAAYAHANLHGSISVPFQMDTWLVGYASYTWSSRLCWCLQSTLYQTMQLLSFGQLVQLSQSLPHFLCFW